MSDKLDNQSYYDAFSETYEARRHHGYHLFLDQMEVSVLRRYLRPEHHALEIGCGTGLIMERVQADVERVSGIDLSEGMLSLAKKRGLDVRQSDACSLPFEDSQFDVVYSFKVLAHVQDLPSAIDECWRVLKPGGRAFLEFYNSRSVRALRKRLVRGEVAPGVKEDRVQTNFHTIDEIRRLLGDRFEVEAHHGVMVLTPAAPVHSVPVLGRSWQFLERLATRSPLGRYGGFLSVAARKV